MLDLPYRIARIVGAVTCAAIVLAISLSPVPSGLATTFAPSLTASLVDGTPGSTSDITLDFSIDAPDSNFQTVITFIPPEFEITADSEIPDGAIVGSLLADATLGLLNSACNSKTVVQFDLMDATTNMSYTIPLYSGYGDYTGNGLPDNADFYPQFLTRIAPDIQPVARYYAQNLVAGTETFLNFVVFEPGAALPRTPVLDPVLGYPTVVFLNDPTTPSQPIVITDFCTPLSTTTTLFGVSGDNSATPADEAGVDLRRNPDTDGLYNAVSFVRSLWDTDNDGIENNLDPCPFSADPGWDPRNSNDTVDQDSDGLPPSCDPADAVTNTDHDGDFYLNRLDNCPLVASGYPLDSDRDGIGDACDPLPVDPSNDGAAHRHDACTVSPITVGAGGVAPNVDCPSGPDLETPPVLSVGGETVRPAGSVASFGAFIYDPLTDLPYPAIDVHFDVTGANQAAGDCLTSDFGQCTYNYLGVNVGTDSVVVTATVDGFDLAKATAIEWVLPPDNDAFASATAIPGLPFTIATQVAAASEEPGEDQLDCAYADDSVWYSFTPSENVFLMVEGTAVGGALLLSAYSGQSMASLDEIGCGYPHEPGQGENETYLFARMNAGETYFIRVTDWGYGDMGNPTLTFEEGAENDANCDRVFDARDALSILAIYAGGPFPECLTSITRCGALAGPLGTLILLRILANLPRDPNDRDCPS